MERSVFFNQEVDAFLRERSANLHGALRRTVSPETAHMVATAFLFALQHGGEGELDYKRDPESSFNPRSARVPLILIENGLINDGDALVASVLATADSVEDIMDFLTPRTATLHAAAIQPIETLLQLTSDNIGEYDNALAASIASALFLDRARHLHLAPKFQEPEFQKLMLEQCDGYITLAERTNPSLHVLLTAWRERFSRKSTDHVERRSND